MGEGIKGLTLLGEAQGTTYTIIVAEEDCSLTNEPIDSILHAFDLELSTYVDNSTITQINDASSEFQLPANQKHFVPVFQLSQHVNFITNGAFDASVFPLVEGWGFMKNMQTPLEQKSIDSILEFVGMQRQFRLENNDTYIYKTDSRAKLDFNAIAQGYAIDVLDKYIHSRGIENYYLELGGELIVRGKNREGNPWSIGIDSPEQRDNERVLENVIYLSDVAIATSGNYRKFYEVDGIRYAHTLNPKTGKPVQHSLLSATVVAPSCAMADGLATAFMVMGTEQTLKFAESQEGVEVYLLEAKDDGGFDRIMTKGFEAFLKE